MITVNKSIDESPSLSPLLHPVVDEVVQMISTGRLGAGTRLPTIRELARKHSVSFGTARAAVGYLERAGIVESHPGSGTYVRRNAALASSRAGTETASPQTPSPWACLFIDTRPHLLGEFNSHLVAQLHNSGTVAVHVSWEPAPMQAQVEHLLTTWQTRPPRAIVIQRGVSIELGERVHSLRLAETRLIQLFRDPLLSEKGWHSVESNLSAAYRMAAEHLIAQGHQRIGLVIKSRMMSSNWPHTRRKAWMVYTQPILAVGYALRAAGIEDGLTVHYNRPVNFDPSGIPVDEANVERMATWLKSDRRSTAVIGDDYRIVGLKLAAQRVGLRVPEDLAVIGIGGTNLALAGGFPTVSLRYDLVAEHLAHLIAADEGDLRGAEHHIVVPPEFHPPAESVRKSN